MENEDDGERDRLYDQAAFGAFMAPEPLVLRDAFGAFMAP